MCSHSAPGEVHGLCQKSCVCPLFLHRHILPLYFRDSSKPLPCFQGSRCSPFCHPTHTCTAALFHSNRDREGVRSRMPESRAAAMAGPGGQGPGGEHRLCNPWLRLLWPTVLLCSFQADLRPELCLSTSLLCLQTHSALPNHILPCHCWPGFLMLPVSPCQKQRVMHVTTVRISHFLAE